MRCGGWTRLIDPNDLGRHRGDSMDDLCYFIYHRAWGVSTGGDPLCPRSSCPERVLRALAPLWPSLYTALEWATQQTRAYFDAEGTPIDRHLAPSLVRYQAKRHLAHLGHGRPEEEGEAYAFQTLPNNGLSLSYRGDLLYVLRILKAWRASCQRQGPREPPSLLASAADLRITRRLGRRAPASLNLLVLWETDAVYTCGGCRWCVRRSGP